MPEIREFSRSDKRSMPGLPGEITLEFFLAHVRISLDEYFTLELDYFSEIDQRIGASLQIRESAAVKIVDRPPDPDEKERSRNQHPPDVEILQRDE